LGGFQIIAKEFHYARISNMRKYWYRGGSFWCNHLKRFSKRVKKEQMSNNKTSSQPVQ